VSRPNFSHLIRERREIRTTPITTFLADRLIGRSRYDLRIFFGLTVQQAIHPEKFQLRQLYHMFRADPEYGFGVSKALGMELSENVH